VGPYHARSRPARTGRAAAMPAPLSALDCRSARVDEEVNRARLVRASHATPGPVAPLQHANHPRAAAQEVSWGGRRRRDRLCRASRDADAQARLAAAEAGVRARGRQPAVHAAGSGRRRRDAPRVQAQVRPAMRALARGRSGRGALVGRDGQASAHPNGPNGPRGLRRPLSTASSAWHWAGDVRALGRAGIRTALLRRSDSPESRALLRFSVRQQPEA
jgi:hypothetical protein